MEQSSNALIVITDWKIEETNGRIFGICMISFPPELKHLDATLGFKLPNPSSFRCALQSIIYAFEILQSTNNYKPYSFVVIVTKHALVTNFINSKSVKHTQGLYTKIHNHMSRFPADIIYVEREDGDEAYVNLDKGKTYDGIDMENIEKDEFGLNRTQEQIEEELRKIRMNGILFKKLVASGAKSYRNIKRK
jgi:hypothetical protein